MPTSPDPSSPWALSASFLPCIGSRRGYLIGWNTAAFKFLVVTLVTVDQATGLPTLAQVIRVIRDASDGVDVSKEARADALAIKFRA